MRHEFLLGAKDSALIIIDMQELTMKDVVNSGKVISNTSIILRAANALEIPVIYTEHNPKVFGQTVRRIKELLNGDPLTKTSFSCIQDDVIKTAIKDLRRYKIIIAGVETHICVLQTVLDLIQEGYDIHVLQDAISSKTIEDHNTGLEKMRLAGVIPCSTEMVLFELTQDANTDSFKKVLPLIKEKRR